jgi:hypothetical protein
MYIFTKFTYNEYIGPYFLLHVVSRIFASEPPKPNVQLLFTPNPNPKVLIKKLYCKDRFLEVAITQKLDKCAIL